MSRSPPKFSRNMPDPKLTNAMEEIKAILKAHDIAGVVLLSSEENMEYLYALTPSWSCAKMESHPEGGEVIRIRSKLADYPSKEAQQEQLEWTVGMFMGFWNLLQKAGESMLMITQLLGEHFDIQHTSTFEGTKP